MTRNAPCCQCRQPFSNDDGRCVYCGRALPEPKARLSPTALTESKRILNGVARRLLAERLDCDPIVAAAGSDDGLGDRGPDESPTLVDR